MAPRSGRSATCIRVTLGNKPVTESLYPSTPDDWLIVAGDVAERTDDIRWSLDILRRRFDLPGDLGARQP